MKFWTHPLVKIKPPIIRLAFTPRVVQDPPLSTQLSCYNITHYWQFEVRKRQVSWEIQVLIAFPDWVLPRLPPKIPPP